MTELQKFCKDEWAKTPPQRRKTLIASYHKRSIAVVAVKGVVDKVVAAPVIRFREKSLHFVFTCYVFLIFRFV